MPERGRGRGRELPVDPAEVDPKQLAAAMEAAGWTWGGGRAGEYIRLLAPQQQRADEWVTVPLNPKMADYLDNLSEIIALFVDDVAAGEQAVAVLAAAGASNPLDEGVYGLFLEATTDPKAWRRLTEPLSPAAREAIVAAVLRYGSRFNDADELNLTRKYLAWWEVDR